MCYSFRSSADCAEDYPIWPEDYPIWSAARNVVLYPAVSDELDAFYNT